MIIWSCQLGVKNCIRRIFSSPFCIPIMHFFRRLGTFINKPLSRDGREAINETFAVDPVKKDHNSSSVMNILLYKLVIKNHNKTLNFLKLELLCCSFSMMLLYGCQLQNVVQSMWILAYDDKISVFVDFATEITLLYAFMTNLMKNRSTIEWY